MAVVDVCLAGGREGIEMARWLREVCGTSIVFVTACDDVRRQTESLERRPYVEVAQTLPGGLLHSPHDFKAARH